ncbi:MerR family transcriptional regulator [Brevibacillus brevis]|uniref:MerR family transcriptional regulator n=1 Tax=Brevibacillus brevis TaxID=1393 RepID=A0ABY9SWV1_BREBE|nr:MerR family transcriptional regulator [Brevibacillus brevis]WNC12221.1 MerR family transcriptional regulator [Brevibacillus brevis]
MYSIGEVAKLTGVSPYTLRYYEKIGVLPDPNRQAGKKNGIRQYTDQDLRFIRFIHGLKQTGMKLEEIASFVEDGCLMVDDFPQTEVRPTLEKRIEMLDRHLEQLEQQMEQLRSVQSYAEEKRSFYTQLLSSYGEGQKQD